MTPHPPRQEKGTLSSTIYREGMSRIAYRDSTPQKADSLIPDESNAVPTITNPPSQTKRGKKSNLKSITKQQSPATSGIGTLLSIVLHHI